MIPGIIEKNFPSYATLDSASVSMSDMGERTISAKVKIDGSQKPEFVGTDGKDWEIEFLGERYIMPLRKPQATKDNSSMFSSIDLTFYHWAIYQMQRFLFVTLANIQSGTPIADQYIASLAVNLPDFAKAIDDMLLYYFPDRSIYVYVKDGSYINPELQDYDTQTKYIEIDHSYIWEVLQKTYELFECRWSIEKDEQGNYAIKFGYPVKELTHIFQYGYEGGLMSVQRQVQDDNIRNQLLGRGGSQNLPYMYFKDYEKFHPNSTDSAFTNYGLPDPDAIPELENILFSALRDKNFRSYIQGWKVNPHRQDSTADGWSVTWDDNRVFTESDGTTYSYDAERAAEDWAYAKGASDKRFNPVEYVKDDESIATYGLLEGGLDNNEDIFPTIQGMKLEVPCIIAEHNNHNVVTLADEIVDVEEVVTDEISTGETASSQHMQTEVSSNTVSKSGSASLRSTGKGYVGTFSLSGQITIQSNPFSSESGYLSNILNAPEADFYVAYERLTRIYSDGQPQGSQAVLQEKTESRKANLVRWELFDADTDEPVDHATNLPDDKRYYLVGVFTVDNFSLTYPTYPKTINGHTFNTVTTQIRSVTYKLGMTALNDQYNFYGEIVPNTSDEEGIIPISQTHRIAKNASYTFELTGNTFDVPEQGAIYIDVPITVTPEKWALVEKTLKIAKKTGEDSWEYVANSSLSEGTYKTVLEVNVKNNDGDSGHDFKVTLSPSFVYYVDNRAQWQPTFDIWIKNVFGTDRSAYQGGETGDQQYVTAVWEPLRSTEEMAITFTTGLLARHSDWEFKIASGGIHYDNSKTLVITDDEGVQHEVRSEWRLTLIKSDAEADSIHKYVPYKDFNAVPHDRFFFTGIYLPWAYVYAAEEALNAFKEVSLAKSKDTVPTWVVALDKVRMQQQEADSRKLVEHISLGDKVWIKDDRFTEDTGIQLYIKSINYTWSESDITGIGLPDIEIVLTDEVETSLATVERIQGDIEELSSQIRGISNLERSIRKVCDAVYLRKDGFEDTSYSPTHIARNLNSTGFRSGAIGGTGWGAYQDENGKSVAEVDKLIVRDELHVNSLVVNQVTAVGGKEILSAASIEISQVVKDIRNESVVYVCYFEQRQGSLSNLFEVDDIAFCQVFDPDNNQTKFYRRRVIGIGANYIELSDEDKDGSSEPAEGDVVVQYGNYTDETRQYVIIRDVIGGGYEKMLSGLNSVTASGKQYYFAGHGTNGAEWFVGDADGHYAQYKNGELFLNAKTSWYSPDSEGVTSIEGGAVMSSLLGVADNGTLVAGINASELGEDQEHGKLLVFAGANGEEDVPNAKTRIYEDGHFVTRSADIQGKIESDEGAIGGFTINSTRLYAIYDTTSYDEHGIIVDPGVKTTLTINNSWLEYSQKTQDSEGVPASEKVDSQIILGPVAGGTTGTYIGQRVFLSRNDPNYDPSFPELKEENIGLQIQVDGEDCDNFAIMSYAGKYGGLRLATKVISSASSTTEMSDIVNTYIVAANNSTLLLPSAPKDGQFYQIFVAYRGSSSYYKTIIDGNGKQIVSTANSTSATKTYDNFRGIMFLIYSADTDRWYFSPVNRSSL